jgi:hypothetical protein
MHTRSAPGKCVPSLVKTLQPMVSASEHEQLEAFQELVMRSIGKFGSADEANKVFRFIDNAFFARVLRLSSLILNTIHSCICAGEGQAGANGAKY